MSVTLMAGVWELPLTPARKLVLLALADWADDRGTRCYPAIPTIARRASISDRQAQRHLRQLEAAGWVSVMDGSRAGGARSRRYSLAATRIYATAARRRSEREAAKGNADDTYDTGDTDDTAPVTSEVGTGDVDVTRSTSIHHVSGSSSTAPAATGAAAAPVAGQAGDDRPPRKRKRLHRATGAMYWYDDEPERIDAIVAAHGLDAVKAVVAACVADGREPLPNAVDAALAAQRRDASAASRRQQAPTPLEDRATADAKSRALLAIYAEGAK